ncbi:helix-turn-helix transcriptional regulator [Actinokineospora bangkokensis]|uniref:HTH luxR-type domain-containing protein n=1 Tax=Actinokineospora bangkokensis TaxID=1193682 RepID=A0A1Q9LP50_9PSEU|nr:LuxR family transcriptional regulator [Actinokineospora bangkokensis]OLR93798.1 hypothetical protein BJP25_16290 [Actinokineospora bangkokensis]
MAHHVHRLTLGTGGHVRITGAPGSGRTAVLTAAADLAAAAGLPVAWTRCYPTGPPDTTHPTTAGPHVHLVDDAHWAPPTTDRTAAGPVLLITAETPELRHTPPSTPDTELHLPPLTPGAAAELLRRHGHHHPGTAHAAAGNPGLLTTTATRHHPDDPTPDQRPTPEQLCATARTERAERLLPGLPPHLRAALQAIAVGAGHFDTPALATLCDTTPQATTRAVHHLRALDLLHPTDTRTPLAHQVLAHMDPTDRATLLHRAATHCHHTGAPAATTADLLLGAPPTGTPWAAATLTTAATHARAAGDHHRATTLLTRALREPLDPDARARLLLDLAATELAAHHHAGHRHLTQVLRGTPGEHTGTHRAHAADLLLATGATRTVRREVPTAFAAPTLSLVDRNRLLATYWLADTLDHDHLGYRATTTPPLPERPADPDLAATAALRLALRGTRPSRVRGLARAALAHPVTDTLISTQLAAVTALHLTDDLTDAARRADQLITEAHRRGTPALLPRALLTRARTALATGDLRTAEDHLTHLDTLLPPGTAHPDLHAATATTRAELHLLRGHTDPAHTALATATPTGGTLAAAELTHTRGLLAAALGHHHDAVAHFREAGRHLAAAGWHNPQVLAWRGHAAASLTALGHHDDAAALTADELAAAAHWGTPTAIGTAHLRAATAHPDPDTARAHLRHAVTLLSRGGAHPPLATALLTLAELDPDPHLIDRAATLLHHHNLTHLTPRLHALTQRTGHTPAPDRLSRSQRTVAELAATGASNATIADRLAVTKRTVELHLTQVYRKLDIRGRHQLPGALDAHGARG